MSWKIQLNSSNNLAQLANNIHPGSDRHITNMARTHDTRPRAMEIIYLSTNHGHNQSYLYHKYYKNSNESCSLLVLNQKSDNLQYNMQGRWEDCLVVDQASDVPSIVFLFHNFLQKSFQLFFLSFYNFTKIKIKS